MWILESRVRNKGCIGEGIEKSQKVSFLHSAQGKATGIVLHERVDGGRRHATGIIMLDDLFQGLKPTVVHVGCRQCHIAQRWCFEASRV